MTAQKILLADDSVTIRKVVELTFADEGIDVVSVSDGDAAMAKFAEIHPDMVIADVNMPGMNGYQICETIKSLDATHHIPVILLVGSFEPFDPGEASRVGANYYFTKPFHSIRELVDKVSEYLALGAAPGLAAPETEDIEHLYNQSFQDTLELPETEADAGLSYASEEFGRDDGPSPFGAMAPVDAAAGVGNTGDLFVSEAAKDSDLSVESTEFNESPTTEFAYSDHHGAADVQHAPTVAVSSELGDAGMDDDIIETTHPYIADASAAAHEAVSPFDERVETAGREPEVETDAAKPNLDWKSSGETLDPVAAETPLEAQTLKFVLDDEETGPSADSADLHVAPRDDSQSAVPSISEVNISPELIETIVRMVIERMSDRAVRETAQEAVPRIAEKLIREALDGDTKQ